jgi:hypothetical protein
MTVTSRAKIAIPKQKGQKDMTTLAACSKGKMKPPKYIVSVFDAETMSSTITSAANYQSAMSVFYNAIVDCLEQKMPTIFSSLCDFLQKTNCTSNEDRQKALTSFFMVKCTIPGVEYARNRSFSIPGIKIEMLDRSQFYYANMA